MSYATQSQLAQDPDFLNRCNSAAAQEIHTAVPGSPTNPLSWVATNAWFLAAAPGFDAAYASALAAGLARPGWDEGAITDGMILSATQALLADYPPDPAPA